MTSFEVERTVLELAKPLLQEIYGDFEVDQEQRDKPDAAIFSRNIGDNSQVTKTKKIGIEITTVDKPKDMQYLNDEKFAQDLVIEQLQALVADGEAANRPNKKISIEFSDTYISDGVAKKASKYQAYNATGRFDELIVLAFSSQFDLNDADMREYHAAWCSYHLSRSSFPFDRVIFVSTCKAGDAVVVYDKEKPKTHAPERDEDKEAGKEIMTSPILKPGVTYNLKYLFAQDPALRPKTKK
jgi:hypothetical protein